MNIDEAITHAREVASRMLNDGVHCINCAGEHEQLAEWLTQLKEYQQLEEQGKLIKLPIEDKKGDCRECVHTKSQCHHMEYKCSECPLTELFCDEFYKAIDRCYEEAYASGCIAGMDLAKSEVEAKPKGLRGGEDGSME